MTKAYSASRVGLIILHLCFAFLKCGSGKRKNILLNWNNGTAVIGSEQGSAHGMPQTHTSYHEQSLSVVMVAILVVTTVKFALPVEPVSVAMVAVTVELATSAGIKKLGCDFCGQWSEEGPVFNNCSQWVSRMQRSSNPDVVFPPHFLQIVLEVKALGLPRLKSVVGGKQGHAPCEILSLQQSLFSCQLKFTVIKLG